MGNCCKTASSSMEFGGDDWGSFTSKHKKSKMSSSKVFDEAHELSIGNAEKERLLGALRASSDANGKVKIKISKKELAVLLGGTEKQQGGDAGAGYASAEQVLVRLINTKDHVNEHRDDAHHRPWKPVLQSIPEVN